jgi:hypothetical protein
MFKNAALTFLLFAFVFFTVSAQEEKPIDVEYPYFNSSLLTPLKYSMEGKELGREELYELLARHPAAGFNMEQARRRRVAGVPLLILGGVGMATGGVLLATDFFTAGGIVAISSAATFIAGSLYLRGYGTNLQRAVNIYNKSLYQSTETSSNLRFQINPLATGLVWSF